MIEYSIFGNSIASCSSANAIGAKRASSGHMPTVCSKRLAARMAPPPVAAMNPPSKARLLFAANSIKRLHNSPPPDASTSNHSHRRHTASPNNAAMNTARYSNRLGKLLAPKPATQGATNPPTNPISAVGGPCRSASAKAMMVVMTTSTNATPTPNRP